MNFLSKTNNFSFVFWGIVGGDSPFHELFMCGQKGMIFKAFFSELTNGGWFLDKNAEPIRAVHSVNI